MFLLAEARTELSLMFSHCRDYNIVQHNPQKGR